MRKRKTGIDDKMIGVYVRCVRMKPSSLKETGIVRHEWIDDTDYLDKEIALHQEFPNHGRFLFASIQVHIEEIQKNGRQFYEDKLRNIFDYLLKETGLINDRS